MLNTEKNRSQRIKKKSVIGESKGIRQQRFLSGVLKRDQISQSLDFSEESRVKSPQGAPSLYKFLFKGNVLDLAKLGAINVGLTLFSEIIIRLGILRHLLPGPESSLLTSFGATMVINKQVVINCVMSFLASLFGGVVYFFVRRKNRWYYFLGFGLVNSAVSQLIIWALLPYSLVGFLNRVAFDGLYSASFRFGSFEIFRKPILRSSFNFAPLFGWRLLQDFLMAIVRITLLVLLGMSAA